MVDAFAKIEKNAKLFFVVIFYSDLRRDLYDLHFYEIIQKNGDLRGRAVKTTLLFSRFYAIFNKGLILFLLKLIFTK